jgi:hypothetical protein
VLFVFVVCLCDVSDVCVLRNDTCLTISQIDPDTSVHLVDDKGEFMYKSNLGHIRWAGTSRCYAGLFCLYFLYEFVVCVLCTVLFVL